MVGIDVETGGLFDPLGFAKVGIMGYAQTNGSRPQFSAG